MGDKEARGACDSVHDHDADKTQRDIALTLPRWLNSLSIVPRVVGESKLNCSIFNLESTFEAVQYKPPITRNYVRQHYYIDKTNSK